LSTQPSVPAPPAGRVQQVRVLIAVGLPLLLAIAIAGCGDQAAPSAGPANAPVVHVTTTVPPNKREPDPPEGAETTAYAPGTTPQFLVNFKDPSQAKAIARYAFAATHMDALAQMPCYCGCALYQHAHTSLQSCYIRQVQSDGKIVYTDHSESCDICTGEVDMMMQMIASTPLTALRQQIATKYGYTGVWTDTPPIQ